MAAKSPPFPAKGDEHFEFLALGFNITYALERIIKGRPATRQVKVGNLGRGMVIINKAHALSDKIDLTKPVIVADLGAPYGAMLIDGYHRDYRAEQEGLSTLSAHYLSVKEARQCCYTRDVWTRLRRNARRASK